MTGARTIAALAGGLVALALVAGCQPVPPDPSIVVPTAVPLPPAAEHPETAPIAGDPNAPVVEGVEPETGIHVPHGDDRRHVVVCAGRRVLHVCL